AVRRRCPLFCRPACFLSVHVRNTLSAAALCKTVLPTGFAMPIAPISCIAIVFMLKRYSRALRQGPCARFTIRGISVSGSETIVILGNYGTKIESQFCKPVHDRLFVCMRSRPHAGPTCYGAIRKMAADGSIRLPPARRHLADRRRRFGQDQQAQCPRNR